MYTSFTFVAIDGVTGLASDPATVRRRRHAHARHPRAHTNLTATTRRACPAMMALSGTTSDGASSIVGRLCDDAAGARRSSTRCTRPKARSPSPTAPCLPVNGSSAASGRLWGLAVAYVYTGPEDQALADDGTLATDGFGFAVRDELNATSVEASVTVLVGTALSAEAGGDETGANGQATYSVREGEPFALTLFAADAQQEADGSPRDLCFEITSLPSHGALYQVTGPESSVPITEPRAVVPGQQAQPGGGSAHAATAMVVYQSAPAFFTVPRTAWGGGPLAGLDEADQYEAFEYRVVACDNPSIASLPVTQAVTVRNINERTDVVLDTADFTVYPTLDPDNTTTAGPYPTQVRLADITVLDPDRGADPVLVTIACRYGSLALDPAAAQLADFNSSRYCATSCLKRTSKLLTFVASPAALHGILGGLAYTTVMPKVQDAVNITIHDGVGSPCLAVGAVPTLSDVSTGCLVTAAQFRVLARNFAGVDQAQAEADAQTTSALPYILAGLGAGILATTLLCCYFCCCGGARVCCLVHPAAAAAAAAAAAGGGSGAAAGGSAAVAATVPASPNGLGETMTRPLVD